MAVRRPRSSRTTGALLRLFEEQLRKNVRCAFLF
jgi:hypothetical protein